MQNKNNLKVQLGAALLGVVATTALVAGVTYAQSGDGNFLGMRRHFQLNTENDNGENAHPARGFFQNEAVLTAIENNDYNAWVKAHNENVNPEELTEEKFNKLVERYNSHDNGEHKGMMRGGRMNEAVQAAIDNNDYDAWLEVQDNDCPFKDNITRDNFSRFVEMHKLMQAGDREGAAVIAGELGIDNFAHPEKGQGEFMRAGRKGGMMNEAIREAIDNNDYNAWVEAHGDNANSEELTQDRFNKMVEIHRLLEDGDEEGAQELMKEVGFLGLGGAKGGRFMKK